MEALLLLPLWKRAVVAGTIAFLVAVGLVLGPGQALASAPAGTCQAKSETSVVRVYNRGGKAIPLRCGTLTYGFNHIVARGRWGDLFDSDIALTIARGEESTDGTVYAWFDDRCVETFRVIVNPGPIGRSGFRPQGVITAYRVISPTTAAYRSFSGALGSVPAEAPRTDCRLFVPVSWT